MADSAGILAEFDDLTARLRRAPRLVRAPRPAVMAIELVCDQLLPRLREVLATLIAQRDEARAALAAATAAPAPAPADFSPVRRAIEAAIRQEFRQTGYTAQALRYPLSEAAFRWVCRYNGFRATEGPRTWRYAPNAHMQAWLQQQATEEPAHG